MILIISDKKVCNSRNVILWKTKEKDALNVAHSIKTFVFKFVEIMAKYVKLKYF